MSRFLVILRRDFLNLLFHPMWLAFNILFPLLLALLLGHLSSGSYGGKIDSYDYYGLTILLYSSVMVCSTAANTFMEENIKRANLRQFISPVSKYAIVASKVIATLIFTSLCQIVSALILIGIAKVDFGGSNAPYILALVLPANLLSSSIGVLACCLFRSETVANQVLSIFTTLMSITSGIFFPVYRAGKALVLLSKASPLTFLVDAVFRVVYDGNIAGIMPAGIAFLTVSISLTVLSGKLFRMEDYI